MSQAPYDAWLIDLDGTLYKQRYVRLAMALELGLFGWSAVAILKRFRHEHETLRDELRAGTPLALAHASPFAAQLSRTAAALGVPEARVQAVVHDWMLVRPQKWIPRFRRKSLLAEIAAFRAAGGRTALVSDYPAELKLRAMGAESLFDVIVASGEKHTPRNLKPDPEGYLRAAELLEVKPARSLVVGDREDADGDAARAAGMAFRLVK